MVPEPEPDFVGSGSGAARVARNMRHAVRWMWTFGLALVACKPAGSEAGTEKVAASASTPAPAPPHAGPLRIGVTLHPYYSWTKNVVGDAPGVEVRPILPGEVDAGNYQPRPDDIKKIRDLDAIVINGIGHDDFITGMIQASGNERITMVRPNDATPLLRSIRGGAVNSHTFISFTNAVQQTYAIERALSALRPDLADGFHQNAQQYAARLRRIKADAVQKLAHAAVTRVVTVHDGYSYLCQELGVDVAGVVEPSHGLVPSAAEVGDMIGLLSREKIKVVLSEESFPDKLLSLLRAVPGVKVYVITHIASGDYTADKFEKEMAKNADTLVSALTAPDDAAPKR
jgi:zinc transport system substrate-binding protein